MEGTRVPYQEASMVNFRAVGKERVDNRATRKKHRFGKAWQEVLRRRDPNEAAPVAASPEPDFSAAREALLNSLPSPLAPPKVRLMWTVLDSLYSVLTMPLAAELHKQAWMDVAAANLEAYKAVSAGVAGRPSVRFFFVLLGCSSGFKCALPNHGPCVG